jgi:hypothetical protein
MNARNALLGLALLAVGAAIGWVAHPKVGRYQLAASTPAQGYGVGAYIWCLDTATGDIVGEFREPLDERTAKLRWRHDFAIVPKGDK